MKLFRHLRCSVHCIWLWQAAVLTAQSPLPEAFNPGANDWVDALALQADGKIVVGGSFTTLGGQPRHFLGRLNADGTLDPAFNPGANDWVSSLVVQADGTILVGGGFYELGGQPRGGIGRLNADGTADANFNPGTDGGVLCLALQADGKIVVGGNFNLLGGQLRKSLGRLNADGSLDLTFVAGANTDANSSVNSLALQADGKILVGGSFTTLGGQPRNCLARLNADGTVDLAFNPGANGTVAALAVQADGKILVGGEFNELGGQPRSGMGRLKASGTLDLTFNPGADGSVYSLAVQTDGMILVGGYFTMLGGQTRNYAGRLDSNGTPDPAFDPGAGRTVSSLALQVDGKIVVGGEFCELGGQARRRLGRLNNTGPASQSLGYTGSTITWLRSGSSPEVWRTTFEHSTDGLTWMALGPGTRIQGGWTRTGISLPSGGTVRARGYAAGGYLNASAWFVEGYWGRIAWVAQPVSRTNDAGTTVQFLAMAGGSEPLSWRWFKEGLPLTDQGNVTGATSPTLTLQGVLKADEGGYQVVASNSFGSVTSAVATLAVVEPVISVPPADTNRMVGEGVILSITAAGTPPLDYRWYHDGQAVPGATGSALAFNNLSMSNAGYYTVRVANTYGSFTSAPVELSVNAAPVDADFDPAAGGTVWCMALQADGKMVVGGSFYELGGQPRGGIGRLKVDGTLDTSLNPWTFGDVDCLAAQADGKIVVGGNFNLPDGQLRESLGRLDADGTLDSTFNPEAEDSVWTLAVQADGMIVVGGSFSTLGGQPRGFLGRLNADGTLDPTFNPGADSSVWCLALQLDGKILVGGSFSALSGQPRYHLGRLNPDGTLDLTFNPGANDSVLSLAVQADGKILVGGYFSMLGGQPRAGLGRLHADGTLDLTFNPGARRPREVDEECGDVNITYRPGPVSALALQADGRIVVGGYFTTLGGQARHRIGRLNADGTLDHTFNPGANDLVHALAVQADGKVVVGGIFATLGGQPRNNLGRLNNTGPATQRLGYNGSIVTWLRGGTSPEVWHTTFQYSPDGMDWTDLGSGTRIPGGWQLSAVALPPSGTLRARGWVAGGGKGSGGFVESTLALAPSPRIVSDDGGFGFQGAQFGFNITGGAPGQTVVVEGSTNLLDWTALRTNVFNTGPLFFSDPNAATRQWRFYRTRTP